MERVRTSRVTAVDAPAVAGWRDSDLRDESPLSGLKGVLSTAASDGAGRAGPVDRLVLEGDADRRILLERQGRWWWWVGRWHGKRMVG